MLAAQRISEEMKSVAQKEAAIVISEAELKAEQLLAAAEERWLELEMLREEVERG